MPEFKLINSPDAVREHNYARHVSLMWVKQPQGHYEPLTDREFTRFATLKFKGQPRDERDRWSYYARENRVDKVRCVAGLELGRYERDGETILVPRFVAPRAVPSLPPPPEGFRKTIEELRGAEPGSARSNTLRRLLAEAYARQRGFRALSGLNPWVIVPNIKPKDRPLEGFPCDDHRQMYLSEDGHLVWTSQPYGYDLDQIVGFADQFHLDVTISPEWSFWNPGKTFLIEWRVKADA